MVIDTSPGFSEVSSAETLLEYGGLPEDVDAAQAAAAKSQSELQKADGSVPIEGIVEGPDGIAQVSSPREEEGAPAGDSLPDETSPPLELGGDAGEPPRDNDPGERNEEGDDRRPESAAEIFAKDREAFVAAPPIVVRRTIWDTEVTAVVCDRSDGSSATSMIDEVNDCDVVAVALQGQSQEDREQKEAQAQGEGIDLRIIDMDREDSRYHMVEESHALHEELQQRVAELGPLDKTLEVARAAAYVGEIDMSYRDTLQAAQVEAIILEGVASVGLVIDVAHYPAVNEIGGMASAEEAEELAHAATQRMSPRNLAIEAWRARDREMFKARVEQMVLSEYIAKYSRDDGPAVDHLQNQRRADQVAMALTESQRAQALAGIERELADRSVRYYLKMTGVRRALLEAINSPASPEE